MIYQVRVIEGNRVFHEFYRSWNGAIKSSITKKYFIIDKNNNITFPQHVLTYASIHTITDYF